MGEGWDVPGVYILLNALDGNGAYGAYVGKAPSGLRSRVTQHVSKKEDWSTAVLICRDTTHGFNSTQAGWLEGRVYQLLKEAVKSQVSNYQIPTDNTLAPYERTVLESCVEPIARVLRLIGFDTATADSQAVVHSKETRSKTAKYYGIELKDLLKAGLLVAGERVVSRVIVWPGEAELLEGGKIRLSSNGITYETPSSAGAAIRDGQSTNGWSFWSVEREGVWIPLSTIREQYIEKRSLTTSSADPLIGEVEK
jgi:hypothetical protein